MYTLFQELLCLHLSTILEMLHDAMYQTTEKTKIKSNNILMNSALKNTILVM